MINIEYYNDTSKSNKKILVKDTISNREVESFYDVNEHKVAALVETLKSKYTGCHYIEFRY